MQSPFALEDLCLVRAIGEAGTLTRAARHVRVDHSTAFRRLGALEERLGVRLFERARDGYTPTAAGEATIATAARILADIGDLERRVAGQDLRPSGIVRVTTTDTLLDLIGPVLADLRVEHSAITIELAVDNSFYTLTRRDADIALRPAATAPETLIGRRLATLATAPYAAPAYLARRSDHTDLSAHAWIGFDDSLSHLASAKWINANVPSDCIVCRTNSLLASRSASRAGMGVAALPCYLGDPDPALRRVNPPLDDMKVSLWLLTHPDLRRVTRIRAVLDFVAVRLVEQRLLIEGEVHGAPQPN